MSELAAPLAFLRRRIGGSYEVDEFGYDADLFHSVFMELLRPLYRCWFRVETSGVDRLPQGSALVIANHAGVLPLDALMLQVAVHDQAHRLLRVLAADLAYRLPVLGHLSRKSGHTLACTQDADRLLAGDELVGVFPEGFRGLGKPFRQRYRLQGFGRQGFGREGFVAAAIRAGAPIVPCAIVGSEEIYPKLADLRLPARALGLPYLPVTPLFPWLGLFGLVPLPAKWMIEFAEPIGTGGVDAEDPAALFNLTDQVRETIQRLLHDLRKRRGRAFWR